MVAKGRQVMVTGDTWGEKYVRVRVLLYSSQDLSFSINGNALKIDGNDQASEMMKRGADSPC